LQQFLRFISIRNICCKEFLLLFFSVNYFRDFPQNSGIG